jgi:hypothetical protein
MKRKDKINWYPYGTFTYNGRTLPKLSQLESKGIIGIHQKKLAEAFKNKKGVTRKAFRPYGNTKFFSILNASESLTLGELKSIIFPSNKVSQTKATPTTSDLDVVIQNLKRTGITKSTFTKSKGIKATKYKTFYGNPEISRKVILHFTVKQIKYRWTK